MSRARSKKAKRLRESSGPPTVPPPAKVPRRHRKQQWAFAMLDGGSSNTFQPNTIPAPQQAGATMTDAPNSHFKNNTAQNNTAQNNTAQNASDDEQPSIALSTYGSDEHHSQDQYTDEPENELDWSMLLLRQLVWLVEITVDVRKINSELKRAIKTRMDRRRTEKSHITHFIVGEVVEIFREQSISRAKEEGVEWREKMGL
ncbi:hypothetical protein CKM354_000803300 [Cercospora kikuchii]|uniref:Uncharacterized protein n=1 Tax=Cercospora kikuchii TaxID=84275 RepID=A0A9P3CKF8_9PEZI|nr:uncharacterized protein CKM354_000803300 [Cercospora kikuchii]GIZ44847.1 hypothetical protein CKM354_000803300 [Cercospora kikuchii]